MTMLVRIHHEDLRTKLFLLIVLLCVPLLLNLVVLASWRAR